MAEDRMRIAYVHDSPLHGAIQTVYDDPIHLQKLGFTDAVVADQMTGCLHSVNEALISRIEQTQNAGLRVWLMDDLFTLSSASSSGCPGLASTWDETAQAITQLFESVPTIRGMVFRFGETFVHADADFKRHDLLRCDCIDCSDLTGVERRRMVVEFLERVVCREMGKRCILRLWDLDETGVHADRSLQDRVLSKWAQDPRFMVSVKHSQTDYWRHQPWNPSIGMEGPARIIEFQCEREYEFIGMLPNWQGPEWSQGPIECGERGRTGLANLRPIDWAGCWIIPVGGGWSKRQASSTLWADMNVHAALALCADPLRDADEILSEWLTLNEIPEQAHALLSKSADLILRLRYLDVWRVIADQRWMPAENWFRDDNFVPGACASIANTVAEQGMTDLLLSERELASAMARSHLMDASGIEWGPHADFILGSYRWALEFAEWTERVWSELLSSVPLRRNDAKRILIEAEPPAPLSVMD